MSLKSPGMCVYDDKTKTVDLYGWKQLKRHDSFKVYDKPCVVAQPFPVDRFRAHLFDRIPADRWEAIAFIVDSIISVLVSLETVPKVAIEGYAHGVVSSSKSILCELGGALRIMLGKNNIPWEEFSPKSAKKSFSGSGNASKSDMIRSYIDFGFYSNFIDDCDPESHPIEDMVDSVGICCSIFKQCTGSPSKKRKKSSKRIPSFLKSPRRI